MPDTSKSWYEVLLLPLVLALVGTLGTYSITRTQIHSADKHAESEEQIELLKIFSDKIQSTDPGTRKAGVQMLSALEPVMAAKLAQAIADSDTAPEVQKAANVVVAATAQGTSFAVIGSYPTLEQAQQAAAKLTGVAAAYTPEIYLADNHVYALTIGGHLTAAEANRRVQSVLPSIKDAYARDNSNWKDNLLK